ncbi:MAG: kynureninase [Anaerolineae bacterium]|nr:kynureninase [Anaerolineae bacterium]
MNTKLDDFLNQAHQLDSADGLAPFRDEFVIADDALLYLDGNSLGRMPKATRQMFGDVLDHQWADRLIRSWGENWYDAPTRIGDKIAPIIGAQPGEVIVGDSTTVNLFKLVTAALSLRPGQTKIISDVLNFPTDLYTIQGVIDLLGQDHELILLPADDGIAISMEAYKAALDDDVALVTFSTPTFKSGYLHEIEAITRLAHDAGSLVLWDFSHGVGSVPIDVTNWGIDFAVGCTYKYLNGGPGSPAFLYVREQHRKEANARPWGWWGHESPFAFDLDYRAAESARQFLVGTPPVLSMLAVEPAVDLVLRAGVDAIREKAMAMGEFFVEMFDAVLAEVGFTLGSPRDPHRRGSHISLRHPEGYRICRVLIEEEQVIPDFREPDNIRLGFAPLYTRYVDCVEAVERLHRVVADRRYEAYDTHRTDIT